MKIKNIYIGSVWKIVDEKSIYNQKIINKPLHKCKRYNR